MNPRKRAAEEPLLPLRSAKHSRKTLLRQDGQPASPTQEEGLLSRWIRFGKDFVDLTKETVSAFFKPHHPETHNHKPLPPLPPSSLPTPQQRAPVPPQPPSHQFSRSELYSSSSSIHPPSNTPRLPLRISKTPASESRLQSIMTSPPDHPRKPGPSRSKPPIEPTIFTSSYAGPSTEKLPLSKTPSPPYDKIVREAIAEAGQRRPQWTTPARTHILEANYKRHVEEERARQRKELLEKLYERERKLGYSSNLTDFEGLLKYRAQIENSEETRHRTSSFHPSTSLVDLTSSFSVTSLDERSRRHSMSTNVPDTSDEFIRKALERAKATFESPAPPRPFSPTLDQLQVRYRKKDASIEARLRPPRTPLPSSLPPKENAAVEAFLKKPGVISRYAREQVSNQDIQRLRPCQWLNDEIINFYGAMILGRSEGAKENSSKLNGMNGHINGKMKGEKLLDVHYFTTFFWHKLVTEGYQKGRLSKWTKKVDIFSKDIVLLPVNHNNLHWTSAAINFRKKRIEAYDSMNTSSQKVFDHIRSYIDAEHRAKKNQPFNFSGWNNYTSPDTPQQENGFDCGVFTCQFMESLGRGEESFNFDQRDIPFLRRKMIWEIGNARFWHPDSS